MSMTQGRTVKPFEAENQLESLVTHAPTLSTEQTGQAAGTIFADEPDIEGIVVLENRQPVGIIMRTLFYQKYGTKYGHSLYTTRSVKLLMDTTFMSADLNDAISKISMQAMSREQGRIYDYIVVLKDKAYFGVISIRHFLVELSRRNDAQISILKAQQIKLISANEQEVRLRQDIENRSSALKNLMDNADQGFLSFESDFDVKDEYSYKCIELFGKTIAGLSFTELIKDYFPEDKMTVFKMVLDSYFRNNSAVRDQVYLMLLPVECIIKQRNIRFDYRKIESGGQKAVMVIMNDVTEKIKLEKAVADDHNRQRLIIKVFGYREEIKRAIREFIELINGGYLDYFSSGTFDNGLDALTRSIHTYKGDFAQLGFLSASKQMHEIEDSLGRLEGKEDMDRIRTVISSVDTEKIFESEMDVINNILGKAFLDQGDMLSVSKERLSEIKEYIKNGTIPMEKTAIIRHLSGLEYKNVKSYIKRYSDYLDYLGERLLKTKPIFIVEGDDIEIDDEMYSGFMKSLVHLFRNIMDHAIESDEERAERGKPDNALVTCHVAALDKEWFQLSISDDGRGIDLDKVAEKAIQSAICTAEMIENMTADDIAQLIFSDRLSTKDNADEISGRGVGLAAVYHNCSALGGKIRVSTKEGQGTVFTFTLPYAIS